MLQVKPQYFSFKPILFPITPPVNGPASSSIPETQSPGRPRTLPPVPAAGHPAAAAARQGFSDPQAHLTWSLPPRHCQSCRFYSPHPLCSPKDSAPSRGFAQPRCTHVCNPPHGICTAHVHTYPCRPITYDPITNTRAQTAHTPHVRPRGHTARARVRPTCTHTTRLLKQTCQLPAPPPHA